MSWYKANLAHRKTIEAFATDHVWRYKWAGIVLSKLLPGCTVIDAACGVGYGSQILGEAGLIVRGYEIDPEQIAHANEHFPHPNVTYIEADLLGADLGQAHVVVSFETLEHVVDAPALVQRFADAARLIFMSVPNELTLPFAKGHSPQHVRHYTPQEAEALLTAAGYAIQTRGHQLGKSGNLARINEGHGPGTSIILTGAKQ